jgi:hypothetical protein
MTDEIHVKMVNGKIVCMANGEEITVSTIAMLLRTKPGGPFDPICVECSHQIIASASIVLAPVEVVLEYLPE